MTRGFRPRGAGPAVAPTAGTMRRFSCLAVVGLAVGLTSACGSVASSGDGGTGGSTSGGGRTGTGGGGAGSTGIGGNAAGGHGGGATGGSVGSGGSAGDRGGAAGTGTGGAGTGGIGSGGHAGSAGAGAGGTGAGGGGGGGHAGAGGSAGHGGTSGGAGGAGGAVGGSGGHQCVADKSCGCTTGTCCGSGCCGPGEWCDNSSNPPACRCGSNGACSTSAMCSAPELTADGCGVICCDPSSPTGCPKSRRAFKRDIHQLDRAEVERIYSELRHVKLTTYQYKTDPAASPRRLGFIIDDTKSSYPVNADGNSVDLYGYMSMAVAAIQSQSREIAALRAEVAQLKRGPAK